MAHLSQTIFFGTNHYYYVHLASGTFHCAKLLKKFLQQIQSYEDAPFLDPKWANDTFLQMRIFSENLLIRLVPLIHANLNAKNQS